MYIVDTIFFPFQELESINEDVQAMSSCCQDMTSRLQVCHSGWVQCSPW